MKRRTFLQLGSLTAAGAALSGCKSANEKLIPYLVAPDEGVTPGQAVYYASACRSCPAGCGILVRVSEGRAKKIEGNPDHPVNRGKLCARGQAALQELYHPDRIRQPLRRSGARGSGKFESITWKEALTLLTGRLKALQDGKSADSLALLTSRLKGSMAELTDGFMRSFGSPHHVSFELLAPDWLAGVNQKSLGRANLPWYDLAESRYLLSFGADFVESHLSPVQYGHAFGRMRQGRDTVRGHFTYIGGRMSLTAASADRWMPTRPGSEGALALGMARLILTESLYDAVSLKASGLTADGLLSRLKEFDLPRVSEQTGLARETIVEVAREFATTRPSLAMAGQTVAFQTNGAEALSAIQLLNLLSGSLNRPGGLYPADASLAGKESSLADLLSLVEAMRGGRIKAALVQGDPVHAIPPASGFQDALNSVPFIVSFSSLLDDTALQADLILPDHSALESWGDVIPLGGARNRVVGLMQPVVTPVFDTRQFGDVLLEVARELGGEVAAALPRQSCLELVKGTMAKRLGMKVEGEEFDARWVELLRRGGLFAPRPGKSADKGENGFRWTNGHITVPGAPRFSGDEKQYPLHLHVYPSSAFYDGRGAALPWLQHFPDPMTTVMWDSWIEINPKTAARLGIGFGDLVEVTSPRGSLRLAAVIYPGIRPDMVAIPLGQGHMDAGRYARGRGVNPLSLLEMDVREAATPPAWNATRVRVVKISEQGDLVTLGNPEGSYRSELIGI